MRKWSEVLGEEDWVSPKGPRHWALFPRLVDIGRASRRATAKKREEW